MTDNITVYWVAEELAAEDGDTAGYEERDWPLVEEFEGEVIDGDLSDSEDRWSVFLLDRRRLTPPIPRTDSVALLMMPIVAAILCVFVKLKLQWEGRELRVSWYY